MITACKVLPFTGKAKVVKEVRQLDEAFISLTTEAQEVSQFSENASRPAFGPYNQPIHYLSERVLHGAAIPWINELRRQRPHTLNAVELRCDALGLAIYVSGINQVVNGKIKSGVRVAGYDYKNIQPSIHCVVASGDELLLKLKTILEATYNRLSREYNLAGFDKEFLTLKSSAVKIPNIQIDID